jgi:holo-[acyl-carrier protein] synthase
MKTVGIGVDIIDNARIKNSIKNKNFLRRVYGSQELLKSKKIFNKTNYFAKRFAAKESLSKAIGTGFKDGLNFKDVQILNDKIGKPYYLLDKKLENFIKKKKKLKDFNLFLSISDEKNYSVAFTIIQSKK